MLETDFRVHSQCECTLVGGIIDEDTTHSWVERNGEFLEIGEGWTEVKVRVGGVEQNVQYGQGGTSILDNLHVYIIAYIHIVMSMW